MNGKWKKWNDNQQVGSHFNFSEAIENTGDNKIDAIIELRNKALETISKL